MKNLLLMAFLLSSFAFAGDAAHKHGVQSKAFNKVLKSYENLHTAFFNDDIKKIKQSAKDTLADIEKIKDETILKTLGYTKKKLQELGQSDDLSSAQDAMNIVSQGLFVVLDKHSPNKKYARYYCPMVKKYWIQNISESDKVMNPYAPSVMPHCGSKK
jgi:hypothetical protein